MITGKPILFQNATLYDGGGGPPIRGDLLVRQGKILSVGAVPEVPEDAVRVVMDGLCISPGWIDLHAHVFAGQGVFSVEPADIGLACGVTTLVDAGSAGALTLDSFARVAREAREEIRAYVNIASGGLLHGHAAEPGFVGDHFHPALHTPYFAGSLLARYPELIVGWKVRLSAVLADNDPGRERSAFEALIALRDHTGLPVMIHHILSSVPAGDVLSRVERHDVITHLYHGRESSAFHASSGAPRDETLAARERGVLFDVGHGSGAFRWETAERACQQFNFWPDTISSDLHRYNLFSPVRDLATTMSKFLHLGAPLEQVVAMTTVNARRALRRGDGDSSRIAPGADATLTLFAVEEGTYPLADCHGTVRQATRRILPLAVLNKGEAVPCYGAFARPDGNSAFAQSLQTALCL